MLLIIQEGHFRDGIWQLLNYLYLTGVAQWTEWRPANKGSPVRFPVHTHAWVAGQVPSRGHARGNHTLLFLSLFLLPFTFL